MMKRDSKPKRRRPRELAFEYIRKHYGVPAKLGGLVIYSGGDRPRNGIITGAEGSYLLVKIPPDKGTYRLHPTWSVEYVPQEGEAQNEREA